MPFTVEMTGAQDYQRKIKAAIGGYPGAGKTLFSSTAPGPFFIFFREQPRIMSIADRYMAHTKVTNQYDSNGRLTVPVWDTLVEVIDYLESPSGEPYQTVVIDTGDELQQSLKEGKKAQNRGKWAIQDWGWLADMYREIVNRIIDMPKHVIVTYHLKQTQEGDDGEMFRELALQGAAKDEAPGWFDVVGVIDSWEEKTDKGLVIPHRGILLQTTPRYPFVKDHSGKLGRIFELSEDFVGDFGRMNAVIYKTIPQSDHEVLEEVSVEKVAKKETPKTQAETGVPTPTDLKEKKAAKSKAAAPKEDPKKTEPDPKPEPDKEPEPAPEAADPVPTEPESPAPEAPVTVEEAIENVVEGLNAEVVEATCEAETDDGTCGKPLVKVKTDAMGNETTDSEGNPVIVPDRDLMDLTMIRFRKHLCREHFQQARKG
jgi:hypothetical protein